MINKKKHPLAVIKTMKEILEQIDREIVSVEYNSESIITFRDRDTESDFYFQINSFSFAELYSTIYSPRSQSDITSAKESYYVKSLIEQFKKWQNTIKEYNSISLPYPFDDVVSQYYKEFYDDYKCVDEDAESAPFNLQQQLVIESYLDNVIKIASEHDGDAQDIQQLIDDAQCAKDQLTNLTKAETMTKLCTIWARARKVGLGFLRDVFISLSADLVKGGIVATVKFLLDTAK